MDGRILNANRPRRQGDVALRLGGACERRRLWSIVPVIGAQAAVLRHGGGKKRPFVRIDVNELRPGVDRPARVGLRRHLEVTGLIVHERLSTMTAMVITGDLDPVVVGAMALTRRRAPAAVGGTGHERRLHCAQCCAHPHGNR